VYREYVNVVSKVSHKPGSPKKSQLVTLHGSIQRPRAEPVCIAYWVPQLRKAEDTFGLDPSHFLAPKS